MRSQRRLALAAALIVAAPLTLLSGALTSASPAAAGVLEPVLKALPGVAALPACDDTGVIAEVGDRLAGAVPAAPGLAVAGGALVHVRQTHALAVPAGAIARRYCAATTARVDGRPAAVYFLIEQRSGFVGLGWLVTACVDGADRWRVHGGGCRSVRHWW